MSKPDVYHSGDYAGLKTDKAAFYYGYEVGACTFCGIVFKDDECSCGNDESEWCFTAKFGEEKITIPFSKLKADDMFSCQDCLLLGIGWILTKYNLSL